MPQDSIVRTIASVQSPGFYLQMDGNGVRKTDSGSGNLGIGHGAGPLDQFRISAKPTDGSDWITGLESVAYPNVFMRMEFNERGGKVNKQLGQFPYEEFIIQQQSEDIYAIESKAFRGVYLRLSMDGVPGQTVVNCQTGLGPLTKFRLETPPLAMQLRVMSYNTHLMQFSFIEEGTNLARWADTTPYSVFEDEARRDVIIKNAVNSRADIISFQEVWGKRFVDYFAAALNQLYPYFLTGDTKTVFSLETTSGLVLASKFALTDRFFERFPKMEGWDGKSNKGVLCGIAHIPNAGRLRVGTGHTTGALRDVQWIADHTITNFGEGKDLPAIMLGDFNVHWKSGEGNEDYQAMKRVFSFPGQEIPPARDTWIDVHGQGTDPNPYTVKMCDNTLHQLFSPMRDTEADTRLDYIWTKFGKTQSWSPVAATVPRGPDWTYKSKHWHWAHRDHSVQMPAAAVRDDRLVVVSKEDGERVGDNGRLMCAIFDRKTLKWRHTFAESFTSASPGIVYFKNKFHLFYRHHDPGNAIFHRSSDNGETWSDWENTGINTGGGVCAVEFNEKLHLFHVDPEGRGGMIFCTIKEGDGFGPGNWGTATGTRITTARDISATVCNDWLVVVSKDNGPPDKSSGVMCSIFDPDVGEWKQSHPQGLETTGSPGVVYFDNLLQVYYKHNPGDALSRAVFDGDKWEINQYTGYDKMRGGVCPVVMNNRLWLFYSYVDLGPPCGYYPPSTMLHAQVPDTDVDVSDHYPLLVDLKFVLIKVAVNIMDGGEVTFGDQQWAGTRGEAKSLDGFRLTSQLPGVKLSYMAHIQSEGDTGWKSDGESIGTRGRRIEGFAIKLEGGSGLYELSYRAHLHNRGDTTFVNEGQFCGTRHEERAVEAIWLQLKRK